MRDIETQTDHRVLKSNVPLILFLWEVFFIYKQKHNRRFRGTQTTSISDTLVFLFTGATIWPEFSPFIVVIRF
jgi:hypothetical protein